jgi:hypothetical protein
LLVQAGDLAAPGLAGMFGIGAALGKQLVDHLVQENAAIGDQSAAIAGQTQRDVGDGVLGGRRW